MDSHSLFDSTGGLSTVCLQGSTVHSHSLFNSTGGLSSYSVFARHASWVLPNYSTAHVDSHTLFDSTGGLSTVCLHSGSIIIVVKNTLPLFVAHVH